MIPALRRDVSALGWIGVGLLARLLREPLLLRSLFWPPFASVVALGGTVAAVLVWTSPSVAALSGEGVALRPAVEESGWKVVAVPDAQAAVREGLADAGTDGRTVWHTSDATALEAAARLASGAAWYPEKRAGVAVRPPGQNPLLPKLLGVIYTLYGAVFGLAAVARDRDDGTLSAELALPIARWVPGAARWLAPTLLLGAASATNVAIFGALLDTLATPALVRECFAAAGAAVAIGLAVVGRHGLDRGLSGPLSAGLVAVASLLGLGAGLPNAARYLPIASLVSGGDGWAPLLGSLACGLLATVWFARRSAVL